MNPTIDEIDTALLQYAPIINIYRMEKGIDKKGISNKLGISLPTVYNAINKLKGMGILRDTQKPTLNTNIGRNSKEKTSTRSENMIELVADFAYSAAISVGASLCKFVLLDMDFEMVGMKDFEPHKREIINQLKKCLTEKELLTQCEEGADKNYIFFKTPSSFWELKRAIDAIIGYLIQAIENKNTAFRLLSIGLTCTGMVNENEKVVRAANNLRYIENTTLDNFFFPDKLNFFRHKGIRIELIQNTNASVIAEKYTLSKSSNDAVRSKKNIVALYLGVGLGAGMYFDHLYSGASGYCGEVGHLPAPVYDIEKEYDESMHITDQCCSCGSSNCYDFKIRKYVFNKSSEEFKEWSSARIRNYLEEQLNKPALDESYNKTKLLGKYLGDIVNIITTFLDVDIIIFTGKLYKSMDLLFNSIAEKQDECTVRYSRNDCMLMTSKYGPSAPAVGAAIYSYYKKYNLDLQW